MTYWGVNAVFLGIAVVVLAVAVLLRRPGRLFWASLAGAAVLLVVLTACLLYTSDAADDVAGV